MAEERFPDFAPMRRRLEGILGYPLGSFDPVENIRQDVERIDRTFRRSFDPEKLLARVNAALNGLPKGALPGKDFWKG